MPIRKINLELTDRCNLSCTMCYRQSWKEPPRHMDDETLGRVIEDMQRIETLDEIVIGGIGEPTMHPRIREVLETFSDHPLTLTTNGTVMTDALMETIVETVDHLVISIDGLSDKFFAIRGIDLQHVLDNVAAINALKRQRGRKTPHLIFQMVLSESNKSDVFEIMDLVSGLGATQFIVSNLLPATMADQDLILYGPYESLPSKKLFQKIRTHALRKGLDVKLTEYRLKTERRCRFVENDTLVINSKGDVNPCYRFAHDGTEVVFGREKKIQAHAFGNVISEHLKDVWESEGYRTYRAMVYDNHYPSCTDCDLVDGCDMVRDTLGDCYGNAPSCGDCLWVRNLIYCV